MEDLNKVVSFILGLVIIVVFLAFISGRIKLGGNLGAVVNKPSVTPTLTTKVIPTATYNKYSQTTPVVKTPKTIPATGSPSILFPIFLSGAASGLYLRKTGKKNN